MTHRLVEAEEAWRQARHDWGVKSNEETNPPSDNSLSLSDSGDSDNCHGEGLLKASVDRCSSASSCLTKEQQKPSLLRQPDDHQL